MCQILPNFPILILLAVLLLKFLMMIFMMGGRSPVIEMADFLGLLYAVPDILEPTAMRGTPWGLGFTVGTHYN